MRRRAFIAGLGAAAASRPLAVHAQPVAQPLVGFVHTGSAKAVTPHIAAFLQGVSDAGIANGRDITEFRWAEGSYERLPALMQELVRRPVSVLATIGGVVTARAAKAATSTIPIVFVTADDPVETGLVQSLNRPDGNMTGVTRLNIQLSAKSIEAVHELLPAVSNLGVLINPKRPTADVQVANMRNAAAAVSKSISVLHAFTEREIELAFQAAATERVGALIIPTEPAFNDQTQRIVALAARHAIPTIYSQREYVVAGGLMSYGSNLLESYHQQGDYVGRILKGAKPADLPVQQPTKVELIINLQTAKALGLAFPITLLGRADAVIE